MKTLKLTPFSKPVSATIAIPGSKSYTNRALLLAALTKGTVVINNPLVSDDTHAMIACLRELGIRCATAGFPYRHIRYKRDTRRRVPSEREPLRHSHPLCLGTFRNYSRHQNNTRRGASQRASDCAPRGGP